MEYGGKQRYEKAGWESVKLAVTTPVGATLTQRRMRGVRQGNDIDPTLLLHTGQDTTAIGSGAACTEGFTGERWGISREVECTCGFVCVKGKGGRDEEKAHRRKAQRKDGQEGIYPHPTDYSGTTKEWRLIS